jgi:flagellin
VYSNDQRDALNTEYQALVDEFGRIGDSTEFNGVKLLSSDENGETGTIALQVGISGDENSIISLETKDTGSFSGTFNPNGDYTGEGNVNGVDANIFATSIGIYSPDEYFEIFGHNYLDLTFTDTSGVERQAYGLVVGAGIGSPATDYEGVMQIFFENDSGEIISAGGPDLGVSRKGSVTLNFVTGTAEFEYDFTNTIIKASAKYSSDEESAIDFTGVGTRERALHALEVTARRAAEVNQIRGEIGSVQSRLTTALSVSQQARENSLAAESRIRDADVAADTATLTRAQILQQVGAQVLSQANQQPRLALQLLLG